MGKRECPDFRMRARFSLSVAAVERMTTSRRGTMTWRTSRLERPRMFSPSIRWRLEIVPVVAAWAMRSLRSATS